MGRLFLSSQSSGTRQLAKEELQQLSRLFAKMLLLAEVESGLGVQSFEPINLHAVLHEVLEFYEPVFIDRKVHLSVLVPDEVWVMGDAHLLANAFSNLTDNFLKYGASADGDLRLRITVYVANEQVLVQFRDDGLGVSEEALERMGGHFFRAAQHAGLPGHGLGLASVRAIARLHQGTISWRNASPGLEIRFTFPSAHLDR